MHPRSAPLRNKLSATPTKIVFYVAPTPRGLTIGAIVVHLGVRPFRLLR